MKKKKSIYVIFCFAFFLLMGITAQANESYSILFHLPNKPIINNATDYTVPIDLEIYERNSQKQSELPDNVLIKINISKNNVAIKEDILTFEKKEKNTYSSSYLVQTSQYKKSDKIDIKVSGWMGREKIGESKLSFKLLDKEKISKFSCDSLSELNWNLFFTPKKTIPLKIYQVSSSNKKSPYKKNLPLYMVANNTEQPFSRVKRNSYKTTLLKTNFIHSLNTKEINFILKNSNIPIENNTLMTNFLNEDKITSLSFSQNSYTIAEKETFSITPIYEPIKSNEIHQLEWSSSNPEIASVDNKGNITGHKQGTTRITVKSANTINTIDLKVVIWLKKINFESKEIVLEANNTQKIQYSLSPLKATLLEPIYFSSENPIICDVDEDGTILANKEGKTNIRLETQDIKATIPITVIPKIEKIEFDKSEIGLYPDDEYQASYQIKPAIKGKKVRMSFSSNNSNVATVDSAGKITATSAGETMILMKYGNLESSMLVTVYDRAEELRLTSTKISIEEGKLFDLRNIIEMENFEEIKLISNIEDTNIGDLTNNVISGKKAGLTTIQLRYKGSIRFIELNVRKKAAPKPFTIDDSILNQTIVKNKSIFTFSPFDTNKINFNKPIHIESKQDNKDNDIEIVLPYSFIKNIKPKQPILFKCDRFLIEFKFPKKNIKNKDMILTYKQTNKDKKRTYISNPFSILLKQEKTNYTVPYRLTLSLSDENLYRLAGNQVKIVEIKANKKNSKISSQSYKNSVNFSGKTKKTYVLKSK